MTFQKLQYKSRSILIKKFQYGQYIDWAIYCLSNINNDFSNIAISISILKIWLICIPANSICDNTDGGFECSCLPGYEMDAANNQCVDVDECAIGICSSVAAGEITGNEIPNLSADSCQNFNGGFVCTCEPGYQGGVEGFDGQVFGNGCTDIDECSIQNLDACRVTQGRLHNKCQKLS